MRLVLRDAGRGPCQDGGVPVTEKEITIMGMTREFKEFEERGRGPGGAGSPPGSAEVACRDTRPIERAEMIEDR